MLGEEEGAWERKKEAGRKEEAMGQVRLPLDRERREGGEIWASGWVRSLAKTNLPQGAGGPFLPPHRWNQRQTGTLQGPAVTPGPKLSKAH